MYVKTFSTVCKLPNKGLMNLNLRVGGIRGASGSCFGQSLSCEFVRDFSGPHLPHHTHPHTPNISRWLQKPIHYREEFTGENVTS